MVQQEQQNVTPKEPSPTQVAEFLGFCRSIE